jgi:ABC-2 type transport system permease protein
VIGVLAGKELRRLFASPLAWVILAGLQVLFAFFFLLGLQAFFDMQAQMQMMQGAQTPGFTGYIVEPPFGVARILLLMVIPLLSMRLISEERRNQTLTFLMSSPLSITQIVIGKFLALAAFLGVAIALLTVMSLSLYTAGKLDHGLLIGNVLGLSLLCASFAAVGLYLSSLTAQPIIAVVGTYVVLLMLWLIDAGASDPANPLHALSMIKHYDAFARGIVALNDVVYYLIVIALFLLLSIRRLDADRLRA